MLCGALINLRGGYLEAMVELYLHITQDSQLLSGEVSAAGTQGGDRRGLRGEGARFAFQGQRLLPPIFRAQNEPFVVHVGPRRGEALQGTAVGYLGRALGELSLTRGHSYHFQLEGLGNSLSTGGACMCAWDRVVETMVRELQM